MDAKDLIRKYEGLRLEAYLCPAGVPTIGYGHTKGVKLGDKITKEQAEKFLDDDYNAASAFVKSLVKVSLTDNALGALTSFVFNLGVGSLKTSTLLKKLNVGDFVGAANEFDKWVFSAGKKLNGLIARRAEEKQLFLK